MMIRAFRWLMVVTLLSSRSFALDVTYEVLARTEVRVRTPLPGDVGVGLTFDLELDPSASVTLVAGANAFVLQYLPTFIWREPQTGGRLLPLHRGRVSYGHAWSKARVLLSQEGAWGVADVGSFRAADGSRPGGVSEVQTLGSTPYLRSASLASVEFQPSTTITGGLSVGYAVSGSPEGTTNGLPLQWGPSGSAQLRVALNRVEGLTTLFQVFSAAFSTGQEQLVATLTETWERVLSRSWSFSLGVGAAVTRDVVIPEQGIPGTYVELNPVASSALNWQTKWDQQTIRASATVRLLPFADRFTGNIYERLEARLQTDWAFTRQWGAMAAASGALAVPLGRAAQAGDSLVSGEAGITFTPARWIVLQAMARVISTSQPRLGIDAQVQSVGTLSVTVRGSDSLAW
jgi:hypothetical protein